jgi:hypothetical protein
MNEHLASPDEALCSTPIYRSVPAGCDGRAHFTPAGGRVPVRIPLAVDNIWEWLRPARFPSRRFSAFGSPTPGLAMESGPADGIICRVLISPPASIAQLRSVRDARHHPDVKSLLFLLDEYEQSGGASISAMHSRLLERAETGELLGQDPQLLVSIQQASRYWPDSHLWDSLSPAVIDPAGEIMFTAPHGYFLERLGGSLRPVSSSSADSQVHMRTRATGSTS